MRSIRVLIVLFVFILGVPAALIQNRTEASADAPLVSVPFTQSHVLTSETNHHDYQLSVALPESYGTSEQSYPVLYVLDPHISFLAVTEFVRFMAWDEVSQLPELIVVGIGYPTEKRVDIFVQRERDYITKSDDFRSFLSEELIPFVDSTYRTESGERTIVGYSSGGGFLMSTLIKKPDLFNRYISIDATSVSNILRLVQRDNADFRANFAGLDVKVFIATRTEGMLAPAIQSGAYDGLEAIGFTMGDITHEAALHLGLPAGILAIYAE